LRFPPFIQRARYTLLIGTIFVATISVYSLSDPVQDFIAGTTGQISLGGLSYISGAVTSAVVGTISSAGYPGIFGLMLLEGTSLPIPSEVILPFAGYLVSIGRLDFWLTVTLATSAGVIGALVDYYVGLFLGMRVISDYGSRFFIGQDQLRRVNLLFEKHGSAIVLASRLIPGARTLASFPAGAARMNLPRFTLYTALGCFTFDAALVYAGDYLGSRWSAIKAIGVLEIGATAIVLVLAVWAFVRMQRKASSPAAPD
jgi:membrane protein DedA with SNARE-associated domain